MLKEREQTITYPQSSWEAGDGGIPQMGFCRHGSLWDPREDRDWVLPDTLHPQESRRHLVLPVPAPS